MFAVKGGTKAVSVGTVNGIAAGGACAGAVISSQRRWATVRKSDAVCPGVILMVHPGMPATVDAFGCGGMAIAWCLEHDTWFCAAGGVMPHFAAICLMQQHASRRAADRSVTPSDGTIARAQGIAVTGIPAHCIVISVTAMTGASDCAIRAKTAKIMTNLLSRAFMSIVLYQSETTEVPSNERLIYKVRGLRRLRESSQPESY